MKCYTWEERILLPNSPKDTTTRPFRVFLHLLSTMRRRAESEGSLKMMDDRRTYIPFDIVESVLLMDKFPTVKKVRVPIDED